MTDPALRRVRFSAATEVLEGFELSRNERIGLSRVRVLTPGAHQGRLVDVLTSACAEIKS